MTTRGPIALLIVLVAILYLLVFLNSHLLYVLVLPVALLVAPFLVFLIVSEIAWRAMPLITSRPIAHKKRTFTTVSVAYLAIFVFGGLVMNVYLLPGKFHPLSLFSNALVLLYAVFIGWHLWHSRNKKALVVATAGFVLFIAALSLLGNVTVSSDKTDTLRRLKSLPYTTWSSSHDTLGESGVTLHENERAIDGINLYASDVSMRAFLMNMSGDMLHTWTYRELVREKSFPLCIELCRNGDLLVSAADKILVKLDWNSNVKWKKDARVHHDMAIAENGDVVALSRKDELTLLRGIPTAILSDHILVFSQDGEVKRDISLFELLRDYVDLETVGGIYKSLMNPVAIAEAINRKRAHGYVYEQSTPLDVFHTNAIEIIDRDIDGLCRKGNILLSFRELDLIGILDLEKEKLVWSWGPGRISRQHQPTFLANGNILLFDNGVGRGFSRVVELDPIAREVVWVYEAHKPEEFYSSRMGSSQRLVGGNTLVTNSESGHAFEVTGDGDVVWEYYSPEKGEDGESRSVIYRMRRITDLGTYSFPEGLEE